MAWLGQHCEGTHHMRARIAAALTALLLPVLLLPALAAAPAALAATSARPAALAACTSWRVVPSTGPGVASFSAVAASGPKDAWAVGSSDVGGAFKTLIEHWNGSLWRVFASPDPASGTHTTNVLGGVVSLSRNNAWAFGFVGTTTTSFRTLALHWNGSKWSVVPSPSPDADENVLGAAVARSPGDIWAVGWRGSPSHHRTLTEHWNGSHWSVVPSVSFGAGDNFLFGAAAAPGGQVWTVGSRPESFTRTLAERWTGTAWAATPTVDPGDGDRFLEAVSAPASGFALTVGSYLTGQQTATLAERWTGSAWSVVPSGSPSQDVNFLQAVVAASQANGWAVGASRHDPGAKFRTLAEHWNGSAFVQAPIPSPGRGDDEMFGLAAVPHGGGFWAVGSAGNSTLTEFRC